MGWRVIIEAFTEHYLHSELHHFLSTQVHYKALEWWIDFQTDSSNAPVKLCSKKRIYVLTSEDVYVYII